MKKLKKLSALALAIMMIALVGTAWAVDTELTNGEVGGFAPGHVDDPQVQEKTVILQKEITAYNPDSAYVYGPEITYTYTIAAASGTELVSITDDTADHASGVATVATVNAGIMTPTMTGTAANTIAWTNADILDADTVANGGAANIKNLIVDFSSVVFTAPGVYRYKITESATYTNTGVTDGDITDVRYLDVYVMRSANFDPTHDGTAGHEYVAGDWSIYGYVCIGSESNGGTTDVTTATAKTNGFVSVPESSAGAGDGVTADEYYTYNFTVTKDLVGDNTMIDHQFPMNVAFSNGPTGSFQLIAETDGAKSTLGSTTTVAAGAATVNSTYNGGSATASAINKFNAAGALASFNNQGSPKVADGNTTAGTTTGYVKYIGIPYTTVVSVTETNDVAGTTYTATVKEDVATAAGTTLTATTMTSTTGTMAAADASASIDTTETATRTADIATANTGNVNATVQFTNSLAIISPTGLVLRFAPYALILVGGIALLLIAMKRKGHREEE